MTKVKMSNEGKIKPSKLSYCSSTCVFLVTHHLPHPLTGILPVFRYTALLSVAVASVVKGKPSAGEDIVSLYTSGPLSLDMAVARECTREHLPSDVGGGMKETVLNLAPCPFVFYILKLLP